MGRKKRRKVKKSPEKEVVFDLKKFRSDLIAAIPARTGAQNFMISWRDEGKWNDNTDEDNTLIIIEGCKNRKKDRFYPLYTAMKKVKVTDMKRIYRSRIGNRKLEREVLVWELIYKFIGEESPLEKREKEESNLEDFENIDEIIRFLRICNIIVPNEMIRHILQYIPRNLKMLVRVGSVCKIFYITMLLNNFKHVNMSKLNLYKISILVLQRVESITIRIDRSNRFLRCDKTYFLKQLGGSPLRKLELNDMEFLKSFRTYKKKCRKNGEPFVFYNVTHLVGRRSKIRDYRNHVNWNSLKNEDDLKLLPNLQSVKGMDENFPFLWNKFLPKENLKEIHFIELKREMNNLEGITCLGVEKLGFSKFSLCNFVPSASIILKVFISTRFPNITECHISIFSHSPKYYYSSHFFRRRPNFGGDLQEKWNIFDKVVLDLNLFSEMKMLKKLVIKTKKQEYGWYGKYGRNGGKKVTLFKSDNNNNLRNLEELHLLAYDEKEPATDRLYLDLSLEEMLTNINFDILSSLKVFKGRLLLSSRRNNNLKEIDLKGCGAGDSEQMINYEEILDIGSFSNLVAETIKSFVDFLIEKVLSPVGGKFKDRFDVEIVSQFGLDEKLTFKVENTILRRVKIGFGYFLGLEFIMKKWREYYNDERLLLKDLGELVLESRSPVSALLLLLVRRLDEEVLKKSGVDVLSFEGVKEYETRQVQDSGVLEWIEENYMVDSESYVYDGFGNFVKNHLLDD